MLKRFYSNEKYNKSEEFRTMYYYRGPKEKLADWLMHMAADAIGEMDDEWQEDIPTPQEDCYEQQEGRTSPHNSSENIEDPHVRSVINIVRWVDAELSLYPRERVCELLRRYEDKIIEAANYYME